MPALRKYYGEKVRPHSRSAPLHEQTLREIVRWGVACLEEEERDMMRFSCEACPSVYVDERVALGLFAQIGLPRLLEFELDAEQTAVMDMRLWEFHNRLEEPGASSMVPLYEELCRVVLELRGVTWLCTMYGVGVRWDCHRGHGQEFGSVHRA